MAEGKGVSDAKVVRSLYQRATGYEYTETKKTVEYDKEGNIKPVKVEETKKFVPPDVTAQIFWRHCTLAVPPCAKLPSTEVISTQVFNKLPPVFTCDGTFFLRFLDCLLDHLCRLSGYRIAAKQLRQIGPFIFLVEPEWMI